MDQGEPARDEAEDTPAREVPVEQQVAAGQDNLPPLDPVPEHPEVAAAAPWTEDARAGGWEEVPAEFEPID